MTNPQMAGKPATSGWWPTSLYGYKVDQKLGDGAASTIWLVKDPKTAKPFVLKYVARRTDKDMRHIEQLQSEFEISKKFTHPVLRKSIDLKCTRSLFFKITAAGLLQEYFDGMPLHLQPP